MADPAALTPESFSLIAIFMRSSWVVKLIMTALGVASLWSWAIIIDKSIRFTRLNREAESFEDAVGSGRSLEEVAAEAGEKAKKQPLPRMLQQALSEWRDGRARAAVTETQAAMLISRIDRALDSIIARESRRVEEGLGTLAIVATASPFVGLFGTVWGIMTAFQSIALQRNTNLTVVAPAIAEALFATAIGLAAAIPAYIAYNKFSTDAAKFTARLESFADELSAAVSRRIAERAVGERAGFDRAAARAEERWAMALSAHDALSTGGRGGRRRRGRRATLSEINVTPLVDVMLVLLIIFMISAPLLTVGVPVDLPKTEAAAMDEQSEPLTITVQKDGRIFLQETETPYAELGARLQAMAGNGFDKPIFVRADGAAPYAPVAQVMAKLQSAGFTSINLITDTGAPTPVAPVPGPTPAPAQPALR